MADSEKDGLTETERKLIKTLLTRVWLSMEGQYEADNNAEESPLTLTREEMNALANAINKI